MKTQIVPRMVARGSYGIAPINRRNGQPKRGTEHVITVWHVKRDGERISTHATRAEARAAK